MGTNKFIRRAASGLLAAAVMTTFVPSAIYASAAADVTTYSYEGFDVTYSVEKTWTGAQSICVTLTNTGDESIVNWALRYDLGGAPSNMWNAQVYSSDESEYIIRNSSWNYEIAPGSSVLFGYILSSEEDIAVPTGFELCSERVDIAEGYDVDVVYTNEWNTGLRGEVTVTNTTDAPIEAWTLSFDTNFEITDLWDARTVGIDGEGRYTIASPYWQDAIPAGGSITFGFVGRVADKGEDYTPYVGNYALTSVVIDPEKNDIPQPSDDIVLSASETEIRKGTGTKTVYFYAQTELDVTSISLYDAESGDVAAAMLDDGNYSISGDDMQGDGVYSCKLTIDIAEKYDFTFVAKTAADGEDKVSNEVSVAVYESFSDDQKACVKEVKQAISALIDSEAFHALTMEEKAAQTQALLESLAENGTENKPFSLIDPDSICYNEDSNVFTFAYPSGILSLVRLNGSKPGKKYDTDPAGIPESNVTLDGPIASGVPQGSVSGVVFYALDPVDFPISLYDSYLDTLRSKGADIDFDTTTTIRDLKTKISGNEIVYFLMHGVYATIPGIGTHSLLVTTETVTDDNLDEYAFDLDNERIGVVIEEGDSEEMVYVVLPALFSDIYAGNRLDESVVGICSCEAFGAGDTVDSGMADAFIDAGAEAVVGFHDSVFVDYSDEFLLSFFSLMLDGSTAGDAYDDCIEILGSDDIEYAESVGIDPELYGLLGAYPILAGDEDAILNSGKLINGDFERIIWNALSNLFILGWKKGGDARIVNQLGPIEPVHGSKMAMLTTGVGSGENVYISGGTEGSYLSQTFKIPEGAETLSFYYNFVSEEPMEFVGSKYDDKFSADIYDVNDNNILQASFESVNTSSWTAVSGINFDGGDSTCYETGWKKVNIDVSECTGAFVSLRFSVTDVGDSIYDTAVLLDNICFE